MTLRNLKENNSRNTWTITFTAFLVDDALSAYSLDSRSREMGSAIRPLMKRRCVEYQTWPRSNLIFLTVMRIPFQHMPRAQTVWDRKLCFRSMISAVQILCTWIPSFNAGIAFQIWQICLQGRSLTALGVVHLSMGAKPTGRRVSALTQVGLNSKWNCWNWLPDRDGVSKSSYRPRQESAGPYDMVCYQSPCQKLYHIAQEFNDGPNPHHVHTYLTWHSAMNPWDYLWTYPSKSEKNVLMNVSQQNNHIVWFK